MNDQIKKRQLQKDINQIKRLIFQTQNERVGQFLAQKLAFVKTQLQFIVQNQVKPLEKAIIIPKTQNQEFITLNKFSWQNVENTNEKQLKVLIPLQNIKRQCNPSQIQSQFSPNSFKIKIHQYKLKNYIFGIPKLYSQIVPQKCSFYLSQNYLNVKLQKKYNADWIDIHFRKDIFKPKKQQEKNRKYPMGQQEKLMDMVKKVYEDGDPQYQKIIKQAFDQANDKRKSK